MFGMLALERVRPEQYTEAEQTALKVFEETSKGVQLEQFNAESYVSESLEHMKTIMSDCEINLDSEKVQAEETHR